MASDKERAIIPINQVFVDLSGTPEDFFVKNPHLKNAKIFVNGEIIPVFSAEHPKLALFAVLLTWFKSPCSRTAINERMREAGMLAGLITGREDILEKTDISQPNGVCTRYFDNFLVYQQDFHHQFFTKYEMLIWKTEKMVEKAQESALDEKPTMLHEDLIKYLKELRESHKDILGMRESNFASKILTEWVISQFGRNADPLPPMPQKELSPAQTLGKLNKTK